MADASWTREYEDGEIVPGTAYRVVRLLGVGGMGSVYEVDQVELGRRYVRAYISVSLSVKMRSSIVPLALLAALLEGCIPPELTVAPVDSADGNIAAAGGSAGSNAAGGAGGSMSASDASEDHPNGSDGPACRNLECYQGSCVSGGCKMAACPGGGTASLSGTVYDPAGREPVYNAIVYIPNAPVEPITQGASCDRCGSVSGHPIASGITDTKGQFKLQNVPATTNVPLVIQVGKWRRQIKIPTVAACQETALTNKEETRLPKNRSEGDMPRIALTTGGGDGLECLLRRIGIDDSEFTPEVGAGRVNLFAGERGTPKYNSVLNGGATFSAAPLLWNDVAVLKKYDLVLLSCEGSESPTNKSAQALQAMMDYTSLGGRVFASHWQEYWLRAGPAPFPTIATFDLMHMNPPTPFTFDIDTTFPKGQALAEWLFGTGGSATKGQVVIRGGRQTIDTINPNVARRWIYSVALGSVQSLAVNTPLNVPQENHCGRIVLSDMHTTLSDTYGANVAFPDGCLPSALSPQEKVLEYTLFDLTSCLQNDSQAPQPPPIN